MKTEKAFYDWLFDPIITQNWIFVLYVVYYENLPLAVACPFPNMFILNCIRKMLLLSSYQLHHNQCVQFQLLGRCRSIPITHKSAIIVRVKIRLENLVTSQWSNTKKISEIGFLDGHKFNSYFIYHNFWPKIHYYGILSLRILFKNNGHFGPEFPSSQGTQIWHRRLQFLVLVTRVFFFC